jgi:hypothetical protein
MTHAWRAPDNRFAFHLSSGLQHTFADSLILSCDLQYDLAMTKAQILQIRLTDPEKLGFQAAADLAGIPLSSWVRERLRLAAIRDLESAGQKIPFVQTPHFAEPS